MELIEPITFAPAAPPIAAASRRPPGLQADPINGETASARVRIAPFVAGDGAAAPVGDS
jgi:hypothetical protein